MAFMNDALWPALFMLIFFLVVPLVLSLLDSSRLRQKITITLGLLAYFSFLMFSVYSISNSIFGAKTWIYCLMFFIVVGMNWAFYYWLNYPTKLGQEINTHTKGFRLFLKATEKDRLNFRNPPNLTPEIFQRYLPYALALNVEQQWAEQFTAILAKADYQPTWLKAIKGNGWSKI